MQFSKLLTTAALMAYAAVGVASPVPVEEPIVGGGDDDVASLEARQLPKFTETEMFAQSLLGIVVNTGRIVNALRLGDIAARQQFTQRVAREAFGRSGGRAVIVCNVGFATTGNIFSRTTQRYDANLGADVTFEVVVLERGASFTRQGDGGFENWAFAIPGSCRRTNGETITC